jgi:hypothetical protein
MVKVTSEGSKYNILTCMLQLAGIKRRQKIDHLKYNLRNFRRGGDLRICVIRVYHSLALPLRLEL